MAPDTFKTLDIEYSINYEVNNNYKISVAHLDTVIWNDLLLCDIICCRESMVFNKLSKCLCLDHGFMSCRKGVFL
jgi:hypothetical protein